jgi:hypothetical protein
MKQVKIVLSSTHIDRHGDRMSKESLDTGAITINSGRKPRLGLEHDMTFPPLGRISNAKVIQGEDEEYYLVAFQEYFDKRAQTQLFDGTELVKEFFAEGGSPFAEVTLESCDNVEILIDKNNFESYEAAEKFYEELQSESTIEFKKLGLLRKSFLNDPELIVKLAEIYVLYFFGAKLFPKIADKFADKIATDLTGIYDLIKKAAKKIAQNSVPKNRPVSYIFEFSGDVHIELIIKTSTPDVVATAFTSQKIIPLREKAENLKMLFNAEKIQFIYNEKQEWELNYLLTVEGETIGTPSAFERRDKAFEELVKKTSYTQKTDE